MWKKLSTLLGNGKDSPQPGLDVDDMNLTQTPLKVGPSEVKNAQDNLRMMEVEFGILQAAVQRFYEAEADGRISGSELKNLLARYTDRLTQIEKAIQQDRSVVALYDLERVQADLVGLFNKHFNDLNKKIIELRAHLDVHPIQTLPSEEKEEIKKVNKERAKIEEKKGQDKKDSPDSEKSEADRRIEKIQKEIEESLGRLSQIEIEV